MKTWTEEEIAILREKFPISLKVEICKLIPKKTYCAIYKKAYQLGIKKSVETLWCERSIVHKGIFKRDKIKTKKGYVLVHCPQHPRADSQGRVFEHIVVWEQYYHCQIKPGYSIHHINGIKDDNRIENLQLLSFGEHSALHNKMRIISEEAKRKMSEKCKERYKCFKPKSYINISKKEIMECREKVSSVNEVLEQFSISKATYYRIINTNRGVV